MENAGDDATGVLQLTAYSAWGFGVEIVPGWTKRDWMDATPTGYVYQCLPITLANQSGWFVLAPHSAIAEWDGGIEPANLKVEVPDPLASGQVQAMSAVGSGILTWTIPYVFRTPPEWNLLCRGPANWVKDGVAPLEGLIETDWSLASFSMNWKLTRPGRVEFSKGEPVAMLVPQRRGDLESFAPRKADLASDPEMHAGYTRWINSRKDFLDRQKRGDAEAIRSRFQKHYFHGKTIDAVEFEGHQKKRQLARFDPPAAATPPAPHLGARPAGRCPYSSVATTAEPPGAGPE